MNEIYKIIYSILKFMIIFIFAVLFEVTAKTNIIIQLMVVILFLLYVLYPPCMFENLIMDIKVEQMFKKKLLIVLGMVLSFLFNLMCIYLINIGIIEFIIYIMILDIIVFLIYDTNLFNAIGFKKLVRK